VVSELAIVSQEGAKMTQQI